MSKIYLLFTIIGFKITWISCVFGELYINSYFGCLIAVLYLFLFFFFQNNKIQSFYIVISFSIVGYFFDSILSLSNIYNISSKTTFLFLPIWFLFLWPSFSCLLVDVLSFLKGKKLLAVLCGSFFGPISYYAGISIGISTSLNNFSFLLIAFFWSVMMYIYANYLVLKN